MSQKTQVVIMKEKSKLTDEEICSYMNFDKLLETNKSVPASGNKLLPKWLYQSMFVAGTLAVVSIVLHFLDAGPAINHIQPVEPGPTWIVEPIDTVVEESPEPAEIKTKPEAPVRLDSPKPAESKSAEPVKEEKINLSQFTQAEPVDGYASLYEYFNQELKYPAELAKDSIEGTVTVSFAINVEGRPSGIKVIQSLGEAFDKESIRLIENMPQWKAATINGKATETRMSIPLTFRIKK